MRAIPIPPWSYSTRLSLSAKISYASVTCGKAVCNLLRYPESQMATAKSGALLVIKVLATLGSEETEVTCAEALAMQRRKRSILSIRPR